MTRLIKTALLGTAFLAASPALAHTGGAHTPLSGLLHPFIGVDHLLAMVGIGFLAAQRTAGPAMLLPAGFVAAVATGLLAGQSGIVFALAEPGILMSLVVFGTLVALGTRVTLPVVLVLAALFGLAHGFAHGVEAVAAPFVYVAAFLAGSALLHVAGFLFGRQLETVTHGRLAAGLCLGASGLALAIG